MLRRIPAVISTGLMIFVALDSVTLNFHVNFYHLPILPVHHHFSGSNFIKIFNELRHSMKVVNLFSSKLP